MAPQGNVKAVQTTAQAGFKTAPERDNRFPRRGG